MAQAFASKERHPLMKTVIFIKMPFPGKKFAKIDLA